MSLRNTIVALALLVVGQAPLTADDALIERLQQIITREVEQKQLPAFSIALVDEDGIVWSAGFGAADAEDNIAAASDTVYRVGSLSKLLTDIAVMQLVERGELDLDADIRDVLPEFHPQNPYDKPLTLRQLMSHRSGLVRESPVGHYFDPTEPTLVDTVLSLNETSLTYPPDVRTKYSNAAIAVAGFVVEKKSGVPFADYMRERLLRPLGMPDSDYAATDEIQAKLADGWMWTVDGRRFEAPPFKIGTSPAGNLYSTVDDLAQFMLVIFDDGKLPDSDERLLRPETLKMMMSPQPTPDGAPTDFGIGFALSDFDGHHAIGHGGAVYGFSTQIRALPEENLGVVAVASLDGANGCVGRITDYALRLLLAERNGTEPPEYQFSEPVPEEIARVTAGRYSNGDRTNELTERGGKLYLRSGSTRKEVRSLADGLVVDDVQGFGPEIEIRSRDMLRVDGRDWQRIDNPRPEEIPERWAGLIGEYGWDHNILYILEDRGTLVALIEWFYYYPLTEISNDVFAFPDYGLYHGEELHFERDASGVARRVVAAEVAFERRQAGPEDGVTFKIEPVRPVEELRTAALAASPPIEGGEFREPDLVELTKLDPTIKLDIRYATDNNFMGAVFYKQPRAFMQRPAAEALVQVHQRLREEGYGLLIHDAYRPWHVTKMFWDATPEDLKDFVADPQNGSRHNRGCAVDLTLYDLETGEPVPMVAGYDEFSNRSFPAYPGGTSLRRWHRELLRERMQEAGFTIYEYEWWHFDYRDWQRYPILNLTFEELVGSG